MRLFLKMGILMIALSVFLGSCCLFPPIKNVKILPEFWNSVSVLKSIGSKDVDISTVVETDPVQAMAAMFAPIVTGFTDNTIDASIGDTINSTINGNTLSTIISDSGDNIVYTSTFSNSVSGSVLTLTSDTSFNFNQSILYTFTPAGNDSTKLFINSTITSATIALNGTDYTGSGTLGIYNYNVTNPSYSSLQGGIFSVKSINGWFGVLITESYYEPMTSPISPDTEHFSDYIAETNVLFTTKPNIMTNSILFYYDPGTSAWSRADSTTTPSADTLWADH